MIQNVFKQISMVFVFSLLVACGGDEETLTQEPELTPTLAVSSISLVNELVTLKEGLTQELELQATFSDDSVKPVNPTKWESSDSTIAYVNGDNYLVTLKAGDINLTAWYGDVSVSYSIKVIAKVLQSVAVSADRTSIPLGYSETLALTGSYDNGTSSVMAIGGVSVLSENSSASIIFSSSDDSIATVDKTGTVYTQSIGDVTINVDVSGITSSINVSVTDAVLDSINTNLNINSIALGTSLVQASAMGIFSDQTTQALSVVTWESSNVQVATVDETGLITPVSTGTTNITATKENITSTATQLTITDAIPQSLQIASSESSLPIGSNINVTAAYTLSDNTTAVPEAIVWNVDNEAIATIIDGVVTGVSLGEVTITATAGNFSDTLVVTVTDAIETEIALSLTYASVPLGLKTALSSEVTFSDASVQSISETAVYKVEPSEIGAVEITQSGVQFVSNSIGNAIITSTYKNLTATSAIQVTDAIATNLHFELNSNNQGNYSIPLGLNDHAAIKVEYSDGTVIAPTQNVLWTTSTPNLIDLQTSGQFDVQVFAKAMGNASLTAQFGDIQKSFSITVSEAVPISLSITKITSDIYAEDPAVQLIAIAEYSDKTTKDAVNNVIWSSSDELVATVSNQEGSKGKLTPLTQGITNVSAIYTEQNIYTELIVDIKQPRLVSGFKIINGYDYDANGILPLGIGYGDYGIYSWLETSNSAGWFTDNWGNNYASLRSVSSISEITNASQYRFSDTTEYMHYYVDSEKILIRNDLGYYGAIQIHRTRQDIHGNIAFSWAIRTDKGTDFSSYVQPEKITLLSCNSPSILDKSDSCNEIGLPYSQSKAQSISVTPRPNSFSWGEFILIALGRSVTVTNVIATDTNNIVYPEFSGMWADMSIHAGSSSNFILNIPATNNRTVAPVFSFDIDNNSSQSFNVSGTFKSN